MSLMTLSLFATKVFMFWISIDIFLAFSSILEFGLTDKSNPATGIVK